MVASASFPAVSRWDCFERKFSSQRAYDNPVQEARLWVEFIAPSGRLHRCEGFWDGERTWRVRFSPDELGVWTYVSRSTDENNDGLHARVGKFLCVQPTSGNRFEQHGPVRVAPTRRYLEHADGTPFFWLADTAWNGPLLASHSEWNHYLRVRSQQKFTAVQWVATQWLTAPDGDALSRKPYSNSESIRINPQFFQQLDGKCRAINQAGLLSVPVMLWAAEWSANEADRLINPGVALPEAQAILLARYMLARWGSYHVAWILPGDGDYAGVKSERWKHIGREVFGEVAHAPVMLHPCGWNDPYPDFADEAWLDVMGYQSGHSSDDPSFRWLLEGAPARTWRVLSPRPVLNLEPAYENHTDLANLSERWTGEQVRRLLYWSLLVCPTAGVSYGGHGVWGWDDGSRPTTGHEHAGIPLAWRGALRMKAAEQIAHLADCFESIDWWQLEPALDLVVEQPGLQAAALTIAAARSPHGDLAIVYIPQGRQFILNLSTLVSDVSAFWLNPRTGERFRTLYPGDQEAYTFEAPDSEDWLLIFKSQISIPVTRSS